MAKHKTWAQVFRLMPYPMIDVSGPAVSNQWIIDEAFYCLLENPDITDVILQLTSVGKLDIDVTEDREIMVTNDSLRNFTYKGIWPSSHSLEHESKRLWKQYLWSPGLEIKELCAKIIMFSDWCQANNKNFLCYQAYHINWTEQHKKYLNNRIRNLNQPWDTVYKQSEFYAQHDYSGGNTVPAWGYHLELSKIVAGDLGLNIDNLMKKLK